MKPTRIITRIGALVLALALVLAIPVASAATLVNKTITVKTGVEIYVDGVLIEPTDAAGNPVETFIYNGTTYVPLRAVSQSLGENVDWDGQNQRVYIGDVPGAHYWLTDVCPPYQTDNFKTPTTVNIMGKKYAHCIQTGYDTGYAYFNLDGEYDMLSFDVGHVDGQSMEWTATLNIYLDGELVYSVDFDSEMSLTHYDVPLYGALNMKLDIRGLDNFAMVNVEVS